jgi:UDP-glucose 4-epimerase
MKKIYITGVAGFLGSHLADHFIMNGWDVYGCDNMVGGYDDNIPDGVKFHKIDCLDFLSLQSSIPLETDVVYHTACTAYEGFSVFSPSLVVANTVQASVNTMTAAINRNVRKFVHCSSMARYGEQKMYPFIESMVCKPQDPYGIAKYSSELILRNLAEIHNVELTIAVPHNIIGPRQKYDDPYRNVASIMINLMLQSRQPIIYGDGSQIRCFSDVADDVNCLYEFAVNPLTTGQIYNIGPDESPITILMLAEIIANKLNFKLDPIFVKARPQEVKFATCSANKIREQLGYKTKVTLNDSLDGLINYILKRGTKEFNYHLDLEIINDKTPETWTKRMF